MKRGKRGKRVKGKAGRGTGECGGEVGGRGIAGTSEAVTYIHCFRDCEVNDQLDAFWWYGFLDFT